MGNRFGAKNRVWGLSKMGNRFGAKNRVWGLSKMGYRIARGPRTYEGMKARSAEAKHAYPTRTPIKASFLDSMLGKRTNHAPMKTLFIPFIRGR